MKSRSFFLFGARATGKSSLIAKQFKGSKLRKIDLLDARLEERYARDPDALYRESATEEYDWIFVDEVQKLPKLLDTVHRILETSEFRPPNFILTGSSARKLKRGSANLLAGRAFVYHLYPLTFLELGIQFDLNVALNWGSLPEIISLESPVEREEYLRAYGLTYLKEEIWNEHLVEDLDPFRLFLEQAALHSGKVVNFANIAKAVGINEKTIKRYYSLLEDTLVGFYLNSFERSIRKRQIKSPKFFLFDTGVTRSLSRQLTSPLLPQTSAYGFVFEHFIIAECIRLNDYFRKDFRFSYLLTKDDVEIDLIVERPGKPHVLVEIKSTVQSTPDNAKHLRQMAKDFPSDTLLWCLSQDTIASQANGVKFMHWQEGLKTLFEQNTLKTIP